LFRLFESIVPLQREVVRMLETRLRPFCRVTGMSFDECDERHGDWRNYLVGTTGDVAVHEEDVLWPNQVRRLRCALCALCFLVALRCGATSRKQH
jgi:hypothetical protein